MSDTTRPGFNSKLACACQTAKAACCKKGLLFLPLPEYRRITEWIDANCPAERETFQSRCTSYGDFVMYDQLDACQFLNAENLCRLHNEGVKPTECFWWPLHVYVSEGGELEIRASTSCCEAYKNQDGLEDYVNKIEQKAAEIGHDVIRSFRKIYKGSYDTVAIRKI